MKNDSKIKLVKHISFLEKELDDYQNFKSLTWDEYSDDRDKRRNVERWMENIVTSSVGTAKIILAFEKKTIPDTYKEMLISLSLIPHFDKENTKNIAKWVRFRNIIVHEYLDIKWNSIKKFIQETEADYREFLKDVKIYLSEKLEAEEE
ncbi:MAG TPA: HepT-like ribonuclease domain-containing protein [bacterium]